MSLQQAKDEWLARIDWRYADCDVSWKFFYESGKAETTAPYKEVILRLQGEFERLKSAIKTQAAKDVMGHEAKEGHGKLIEAVEKRIRAECHEEILGLKTEVELLIHQRDLLNTEVISLKETLAESRLNDCIGMGYLTEVRQIVGGKDFPEMVENVRALAGDKAVEVNLRLFEELEKQAAEIKLLTLCNSAQAGRIATLKDTSKQAALIEQLADSIKALQGNSCGDYADEICADALAAVKEWRKWK